MRERGPGSEGFSGGLFHPSGMRSRAAIDCDPPFVMRTAAGLPSGPSTTCPAKAARGPFR